MCCLASDRMVPQLGISGESPTPRNVRLASFNTVSAMINVRRTMIGDTHRGRI